MNLIATLVMTCSIAAAHTRLECPPPRSAKIGAKIGPCDAPDDLTQDPFPMQPGLNTITWLEGIGHPGAPGRLALSLDGSDDGFESCVLLDHIPHDENSQPIYQDPLTYHRSSITIWLPDIKCERCNLQLITYMTDDVHNVPYGTKCVSPAALGAGTVNSSLPKCDAVYHSCAPISIDGTTPRSDHTCDLAEHNTQLGWPFMDPATASGATETAMSTYLFKGDPGLYSKNKSVILSSGSPIAGGSPEDCPECCPTETSPFYCDPVVYYNKVFDVPLGAKYASLIGTCAAVVDLPVENFVFGQLPSTPKSSGGDDSLFLSDFMAILIGSIASGILVVGYIFTVIFMNNERVRDRMKSYIACGESKREFPPPGAGTATPPPSHQKLEESDEDDILASSGIL